MYKRKCNVLWWKPINELTLEDLGHLKKAFLNGYIPLGDRFSEHNPQWKEWKQAVEKAIQDNL